VSYQYRRAVDKHFSRLLLDKRWHSRLRKLTGEQLRVTKRHISFYEDQYDPEDAGGGTVDDFEWFATMGFPISFLDNRRTWAAWMRKELAGDGARIWGDLLKIDLSKVDPVIVVQGADDIAYLWDGNHRVGVAAMRGYNAVPALVGVRMEDRS